MIEDNAAPPAIMDFFVLDEARSKQITACDYVERKFLEGYRHIVVAAPTGCHAAGQKIIMYSGRLKPVEAIRIGDLLMGPDSRPRKVLSLIRGSGQMYEVIPTKGLKFTVNDHHVLNLQRTNDGCFKSYSKINIAVESYLKTSKTFKHLHKLWRPEIVNFKKQKLVRIPPYFMGLWLGDGSSAGSALTTADIEIEWVWRKFVEGCALKLRTESKLNNKAKTYTATTGKIGGDISTRPPNFILNDLKHHKVLNNKHIPYSYKLASAAQRLELLAGLFDSDGSLSNNCYEFSSKYEALAKDVAFIARSLGMSARCCLCQKSCQDGFTGIYWRVTVSGHTGAIPCLINRKKAQCRKQKKSVLRTGFKINPLACGKYYGFELNGDQLYLLEDFTVTHNSGKSAIGATACFWAQTIDEEGFEVGGYYLVTQKLLQDQLKRDFKHYKLLNAESRCHSLKSATEYSCHNFGNCGLGMSAKPKCSAVKSGTCSYTHSRAAFSRATMAVTNYPYLMTEHAMAGQMPPRKLLVLDECHSLERQILRFIEISITQESLRKWAPTIKAIPDFYEVSDFAVFLKNEYIPVLEVRLEALVNWDTGGGTPDDKKIQTEKMELGNHLQKITRGVDLILDDPQNWVFDQFTDRHGASEVTAKPLDAAPFAQELLFDMGYLCIHMSAYPGSKKIYCESLGLDPDKVAWMNLNSTFPVKNREIFMTFVGSMSKKNRDRTLPDMLDYIQQVMEGYDTKGIIHCNSYELGRAIYEGLRGTKEGKRILFPQSSDDRESTFLQHKQATHGSVILSPSMTEGFDFSQDLARFQIIAKMPFPYLGDKQVAAKKDLNPDWYALQAVMSIIQACGRIVRSETDEGHTYILDSDFMNLWENYQEMFPRWWIDAVVWPPGRG